MVYLYNGTSFSNGMKCSNETHKWMDLENMLSKRSKSQNIIYHIIPFMQRVENRHRLVFVSRDEELGGVLESNC